MINRLREKDTKISKQESTIKDLASRINELERKTEEQNKELELMKSMKDEDYIRWVEAAKTGDTEVIQFFIDKRIDVNISRSNYPALLLAAKNGHEKIVEMLLKAGADVNYCYFFSGTALCRAASKAHVCVVNTLLKKGADPNKKGNSGGSPLMKAVSGYADKEEDVLEVVKSLLRAGAIPNDIDDDGETVLTVAEKYGYMEVAELLKSYPI